MADGKVELELTLKDEKAQRDLRDLGDTAEKALNSADGTKAGRKLGQEVSQGAKATADGRPAGEKMGREMAQAVKSHVSAGAIAVGNLFADAVQGALQQVGQVAADIVDTGSGFEASMSNVAALSGAAGQELAALEATARELGATTQFSAAEAADALGYMALAGWDAQQSMEAIPGVLNLAAASGMELAAASDMVTDYLSAFGLEAQQAGYFADMLAYAQANSNTSAEQLGEAYRNCAASLNAAGQDVETVTSLLASMANQGLKGSEAGTALTAMMRDVTSRMKNGSIQIGKTSVAVQDADGNFRDLTAILKDVERATRGMGSAEKAAALSSTFTADSIKGLNLVLNDGVDSAADFEDGLRGCEGAAGDMADTMNDNLAGDVKKAQSALQELYITVFQKVEPALRLLVQAGAGIATFFADLLGGADDMDEFGDSAEAAARQVENLSTVTGSLDDALGAVDGSSLQGLADAAGDVASAVDGAGGSVAITAEEVERVAARTREVTAEAAQDIRDMATSVREAELRSDQVREYAATIDELRDREGLTEEQQHRLEAAVRAFNDATGASIEVIDSQNGKLSETPAKIDAIVEAYARQAEIQAYTNGLTELYEDRIKATDQLKDATEAYKASLDATLKAETGHELTAVADGFGMTTDQIVGYLADGTMSVEELVTSTKSMLGDLSGEFIETFDQASEEGERILSLLANDMDDVAATMADAQATVDGINSTIEETEGRIQAVVSASGDAGKTLEELTDGAEETAESIKLTAEAFKDATPDDLVALMDALTYSAEDAGAAIDQAFKGFSGNLEDVPKLGNEVRAALTEAGIACDGLIDRDIALALANQMTGDMVVAMAQAMAEMAEEAENAGDAVEEALRPVRGTELGAGSLERLSQAFSRTHMTAEEAGASIETAFRALKREGGDLADVTKEVNAALKDAGVTTQDLSEDFVRLAYEEGMTGGQMVEYVGELVAAAEAEEAAAKAAEEQAEAARRSAEAMREFADSTAGMNEALAKHGYTAEEFAAHLDAMGRSVEEFKGVYEGLAAARDPLSTIEQKTGVYTWKMKANLEENARITQQWSDNIVELYGRCGNEAEYEFMQYVESLGPEYNEFVEYLAHDADVSMEELARLYSESGTLTAERAVEVMEASIDAAVKAGVISAEEGQELLAQTMAEAGEQAVGEMADGVESGADEVGEAAVSVGEQLVGAVEDTNSEMEERGRLAALNFAYGMEHADMASAADGISSALAQGLGGIPTAMEALGAASGEALTAGISGGAGGTGVADALAAELGGIPVAMGTVGEMAGERFSEGLASSGSGGEGVVSGLVEALGGVPEAMGTIGREGGSELASGLTEGEAGVDAAAGALNSAIAGKLANIPTATGAVGRAVGGELADGIASAESDVTDSARTLNVAASDAIVTLAKGMEQGGRDAGTAFGLGLASQSQVAAAAAGEINTSVASAIASLVSAMDGQGQQAGQDFAFGLDASKYLAESAAGNVAASAKDGIGRFGIEAYWSGHELGSNFAAGIRASVSLIAAAANEAAGAAADPLHFSEPKVGPLRGINRSGGEMVRNYARSMLSQIGALERASEAAAEAAGFAGSLRAASAVAAASLPLPGSSASYGAMLAAVAPVVAAGGYATGAGGDDVVNVYMDGWNVNDRVGMQDAAREYVGKLMRLGAF